MLRSKTGRKIRKDSFEAKNDMDFVLEKLQHLYIGQQLSTTKIPQEMFNKYGMKITSGKCYQLILDLGILRNKSESISIAKSSLDYKNTFLKNDMISVIDGIVIGDGTISINENTKVGRLSISGSQKEFIQYCYRLLKPYMPSPSKYNSGSGRKGGTGTWSVTTKHHPDFYLAYQRWYSNKKDVPNDLILTPMLMLLWYLGDGSLSSSNKNNSKSLYFSTNSFSRKAIEYNLLKKLDVLGFETSRITKDNRLYLKTSSIVPLLKYMGGKSPVECYSYKFDIEEWRLKKTMKQVSKELNLNYGKLSHWVKTGFVNYSRSPGGKKVLFSDKEFDDLKKRIECGELPREKNKKATRISSGNKSIKWDSQILKDVNENDFEYLSRIAETYIQNGFPYKIYSKEKKEIKWYGLRKSQYCIPTDSEIKWRRHGLSLADSFHPHIFELNRKNKISPFSLFHNTTMLIECLKKNNALSGTLTYAKIHSAVCSDVRSPRLNNFSPLIARDFYNYYCKDGDKVLDPCSGFSGRLIGASISKRNISYDGIEPSFLTYNGLVKTQAFLKNVKPEFVSNIENGGAENILEKYKDDYFNFCFTSPPYFDTEEYSKERTQSHVKFNSYEKWKSGFLHKIFQDIYRVIKNNSYFLINIGKFGKHEISEDIEQIALNIGFVLEEKKHISFPIYGFVNSSKDFRNEPLLVLKKP